MGESGWPGWVLQDFDVYFEWVIKSFFKKMEAGSSKSDVLLLKSYKLLC